MRGSNKTIWVTTGISSIQSSAFFFECCMNSVMERKNNKKIKKLAPDENAAHIVASNKLKYKTWKTIDTDGFIHSAEFSIYLLRGTPNHSNRGTSSCCRRHPYCNTLLQTKGRSDPNVLGRSILLWPNVLHQA